jgi:hypothetical protein
MGANGQGGGLSIGGNPLSLVRNCTFLGNYKPLNGADGGAVQFISVGYFENNVVVGSHGGGAIDDFGGVETSCNVFWDNAQGIGVPLSPTDRVVDPLFCNPAAYDLTLDSTSPCLPPYSLGCGLIGALGIGCGTTAAPEIPTRTWGQIKGLYR